MFSSVKEYATVKQLMERNSEIIKLKEDYKVKAVDCKIMSLMLTDIMRHKTVLKVEDEDFIFIRRAINNKSEQKINRQK